MRLVSVTQMKDLERQADAGGLSYDRMMVKAGKGLANLIHTRFWSYEHHSVLGLVGSGNNGGDTLIALAHLSHNGWRAKAYIVNKRETDDHLITEFLAAGGEIAAYAEDTPLKELKNWVNNSDILLDGILGTGTSLPLRGSVSKVLSAIRSSRKQPLIVAVDCPSGIDCDSGDAADECLKANLTICMAGLKQGLLKYPAYSLVGELAVVDIGLPVSLQAWKRIDGEVMTAEKAAAFLPHRAEDAHKGTFGTCMIVGGSVNYCGAPLLASEAAYRVGVGLVRTTIPGAIYDAIAGCLPETTWLVLPFTDGMLNAEGARVLRRNMERVSAMLIGPGLGFESHTQDFLTELLENSGSHDLPRRLMGFSGEKREESSAFHAGLPSLIVDADGLRQLAKIKDWPRKLGKTAVLTPHPGEMSTLTGMPVEEIQRNRTEITVEYARKWGHVVVLKGALTVTADPTGKYMVNPRATSALATAGTGDVLAGMITGLIAQGLSGYKAAVTGVWLHAQAGFHAAESLGSTTPVMARDVLKAIPSALKTITGTQN